MHADTRHHLPVRDDVPVLPARAGGQWPRVHRHVDKSHVFPEEVRVLREQEHVTHSRSARIGHEQFGDLTPQAEPASGARHGDATNHASSAFVDFQAARREHLPTLVCDREAFDKLLDKKRGKVRLDDQPCQFRHVILASAPKRHALAREAG